MIKSQLAVTDLVNCCTTLSISATKEYSQELGGRGVDVPAINCTADVEWGAVVPKYGYTYLMYRLPLLTEGDWLVCVTWCEYCVLIGWFVSHGVSTVF